MPYGVSNSCKRGTMRTYAKRQIRSLAVHQDEAPRTIIRMTDTGVIQKEVVRAAATTPEPESSVSAPSSSPSHRESAVFSDPSHAPSASPASSPPPCITPPARQARRSSLKRKRSAPDKDNEPLAEIDDNDRNSRKHVRPMKKTRLTQTQIDLGGEVRRACKDCGMEYVPSNKEDAALHKQFHAMNVGGVDMGKNFVKDVKIIGRPGEGEAVAMVDGRSSPASRRKAEKVLEVVRSDLGAVEVESERLWSSKAVLVPKNIKTPTKNRSGACPGEREDRFRVLLYMFNDKCVGLCLAERIRNASKVIGSAPGPKAEGGSRPGPRSSSITSATSKDAALLGISRIWTSKSHRRKGIASALLDCARRNFFYGIEVPKEMVAFSQPTESGGQLAEQWFGEKTGWHVYTDS